MKFLHVFCLLAVIASQVFALKDDAVTTQCALLTQNGALCTAGQLTFEQTLCCGYSGPIMPMHGAEDGNGTCGEASDEEYDMPLHIGALFIILATSLLGTVMPFIFFRCSGDPMGTGVFATILKMGRAFGAGVILATAFVHMFIPAVAALTNSCLDPMFSETYTAFAGLFALAAALLVHAVEFFSTALFEKCLGGGHHDDDDHHHHHHHTHEPVVAIVADKDALPSFDAPSKLDPIAVDTVVVFEGIKPAASPSSDEKDELDCEHHVHSRPADHPEHLHHSDMHEHAPDHCAAEGHIHHPTLALSGKMVNTNVKVSLQMKIVVLVLELGIAIHSVIIGISLGAIRGEEFHTLIIALVFHQFFEGFALGATLVQAQFKTMTIAIFTIIWYSLTTPLGVAIGIGIANTYSDNAPTTLLAQGVLDAVCAGILIYTALVEILTYQFTNNPHFRNDTRLTKALCFLALYVGAGIMAFIGLYA